MRRAGEGDFSSYPSPPRIGVELMSAVITSNAEVEQIINIVKITVSDPTELTAEVVNVLINSQHAYRVMAES